MKILQINSFGYYAGGTEKSVTRLKQELVKKGHEVKILTSNYNVADDTFADYTFKHAKGVYQLLFRLFNPYSYRALKKVLKEYQPDVIHFHRMDLLSPSVLFLTKKYPTLITLHGPEDFITSLLIWFMPHSYFKNKIISRDNLNFNGKLHYLYHAYIQKFIYNLGLKNVDVIISPSKGFTKSIDKKITNVTTVYNGVTLLNYFKKFMCDYKLLYVGRLDSTKGIEYAINSLQIIIKKFPKTTLTIVGEGIFKLELITLTKKLHLENNVKFITWQKKELIEEYYKISDIILVPSVWPEPFGLVGPEAMSVGRPVIASKVGGIPEWLENGKTGFLVEPKNSQQIAEKVIKLFSDQRLLVEMGENARKKAEKFSIENNANNTEKIYLKLLQNTKKRNN